MVLLNEVWDNRRRGLGSAIVQAMSSAGTAMASIAATLALTYFDPTPPGASRSASAACRFC